MLTKEETLAISRQVLREMGLEDRYAVSEISWPCLEGQWNVTFRHRYGLLFPVCVDWHEELTAEELKSKLKQKLRDFKDRSL